MSDLQEVAQPSPPPPKPALGRIVALVAIGLAVVLVVVLAVVLLRPDTSDNASGAASATGTPATKHAATPLATPSAGTDTSAAKLLGWGQPASDEEFDAPLGPDWDVYDGPGNDGKGRRSPSAVGLDDGIMTITGDAQGTTAGMAWLPGRRYGRWEGRVRAPASDKTYNALLLLWPDAEDWPVGGEVDFMEMDDPTRQTTEMFLHYGRNNNQDQGEVAIDATQWHNWAVEWTPTGITAYVDGKPWYHTTNRKILPPRPMHLTIQLDWLPENGDPAHVTPSTMQVDWVKEYAIPGT